MKREPLPASRSGAARREPYTAPRRLARELGNAGFARLVAARGAPRRIQRMTLTLGPLDETLRPAAAEDLKRQTEGREDYPPNPWAKRYDLPEAGETGPAQPLADLDPSEPLTIIAHADTAFGDGRPRLAGLGAQELLDRLRALGLTSAHRGDINLSACTTAWRRLDANSFAEDFVAVLREHGYHNDVTGYASFVSTTADGDLETPFEVREERLATYQAAYYFGLLGEYQWSRDPKILKEILEEIGKGVKDLEAEASRGGTSLTDEVLRFYVALVTTLKTFLFNVKQKEEGTPLRGTPGDPVDAAVTELQRLKDSINRPVPGQAAKKVRFSPPAPPESHRRGSSPRW